MPSCLSYQQHRPSGGDGENWKAVLLTDKARKKLNHNENETRFSHSLPNSHSF